MTKLFNKEALKRIFDKKKSCENYNYKDKAFVLQMDSPNDDASYFDTSANWKRILLTVGLLFLAMFLQESLFNSLRFVSVKPGLFLVVLAAIATCSNFTYSLVMGALSGFIIDIAYGRFLGFYAIIYMYIAVISSILVSKSKKGKPFYFFWYAPLAFFVFGLFQSMLSRLLTMYNAKNLVFFENFGSHVLRRLIPGALYNGLLFMILIWPITFLWSKLGKKYISRKRMFK